MLVRILDTAGELRGTGRVLAALGASIGGLVVSTVGWVAASAAPGGTDIGPIIGGLGNGVAVAALAYVVRSVLSGNLVARSSASVEARLLDLVETSHEHVELLYDAFKKAGYPATKPARPRHRSER